MSYPVNIDGVRLTTEMLATIREWQDTAPDLLIRNIVCQLDELSGLLLNNWDEFYDVDEIHIKDHLIFLHRLKTDLKRFIPEQKGGDDEN